MKKLFPILLLITYHAVGQNYVHTRSLVIMGDSIRLKRIDLEFRKPTVQLMDMGMSSVYSFPETNVVEGNGVYQKSKVILYQIAMSDSVTVEMMDKIKQAIDGIMFGGTVDPPPADVIDTIDAVNSTFVGAWSNVESSTANWYGSTLSFSNATNAYATYKHAANYRRVEIWAEKKSTHGIIALSINSGPEVMVDLYSPTYQIPHMVHAFDVPLGVHEIKYRITGTKNAASSNTYGLIDFYRFFR